MERFRKILIAGVGNILRADDGLGPLAVERLGILNLPKNADVIELGTPGLAIFHYVKEYDKVIFIDAIQRRGKPGSIYVLKPHDLAHLAEDVNLLNLDSLSMHEIGLEEAVAIGVALGEMPNDIVVIGCEPENVNTFGIGLTDKVRDALPEIIELVLKELDTP